MSLPTCAECGRSYPYAIGLVLRRRWQSRYGCMVPPYALLTAVVVFAMSADWPIEHLTST